MNLLISSDQWLLVAYQALAAAIIGPSFAMLFTVPARHLLLISLASAITRAIRAYLVYSSIDIVAATFLACAVCSLIFIYFGPKFKVPRPIFTVPCIISLIPGVDAYQSLLSLVNILHSVSPDSFNNSITILFTHGMRALAIIFAIAIGLAVPPLFFYKYRHAKL
ncbi:threonine/serine exporter family protein [Anaerobiospirillum sp. NML120448]|uniref:threonine/serine exporter family protein n=1 Tax=Anaerobiospirillum sp. NML120448 TaxID=2932816 RepID=UPI001FF6751D|nr:threonine/serine exporter family protein [Anaerobiospirillum sp. NML120448]MCK0514555.1 threonine/serine exporter family protein [Anaerobiospirillum sp. NML120448]